MAVSFGKMTGKVIFVDNKKQDYAILSSRSLLFVLFLIRICFPPKLCCKAKKKERSNESFKFLWGFPSLDPAFIFKSRYVQVMSSYYLYSFK